MLTMVEIPEHEPRQEVLKQRKSITERYLYELLPQNTRVVGQFRYGKIWYETVDDIVDFYQDESKGLSERVL